ncbi:hypothetical protein [Jongsikchunia kroppenstedtii]|uniref:hypothetical protein n=1 Tax=Jongsikchunia kroppenstedtii TaxID=1121721 RepID=UPI00035F6E3E|nr:hypothetical protein [Jongsikchunia kroppenstedtii]
MLTGVPDIDDADALAAADVDGLLRSTAMSGATIRAVAEAVSEGVTAPLNALRPRAVVIVTATRAARLGTEVVGALFGPRLDAPLVPAPSLPTWIGPLDVVVLLGDDAGDPRLVDAAGRALRRHAEVVIAAPLEGPLAEVLGDKAIDLSPRFGATMGSPLIRHAAALVAVCSSLSAVRGSTAMPLARIADDLDTESVADHPDSELFHNAAKLLAERLQDRSITWVGDTPGTCAVAAYFAERALAVSGIACAAAEVMQAMRAPAGSAPTADALFHDPQIDGPAQTVPNRFEVISVPGRAWLAERRTAAAPDVEVLVGTESETSAAVPQVSEIVESDQPDDLVPLLILVQRIEMALVYLRLVGGR